VCAFCLIIALVISASRGTAFFSPGWQLGSRLESFPSLSEAKNSSLDPSDTCNVGRWRVWPSGKKSQLCRHSGSLCPSVLGSSNHFPNHQDIPAGLTLMEFSVIIFPRNIISIEGAECNADYVPHIFQIFER
jgi:hypothetical protein